MKRINLVSTLLLVAALALAAFPTSSALAATDTVGPITSAVAVLPNPATVNTTVTVTATVDDSTTGASNIQSAEFNVNGGTYTAMTASDGAFDTATENVTATFTVPLAGSNQVCAHGTDAAGNVGADVCTTVTGQYLYKFGGFKPPVRPAITNSAKAGQTVPIKWKLTLTATGAAVSDPASFVAAKSYQVDCTSLTGDSSTAVIEKTTGKSGLRYLNGGNWIFNWKTDKSYSGTCRRFFLQFSDTQLSPEVVYSFK
jgi:hypothetical protein